MSVFFGALAAPAPASDSLAIGPGAIVARVIDERGKPLGGALVVAEGPAARDAVTTIGGVVTLLDLPLGTYDVRVTRDGYEPADARVRVGSTGSLRVTSLRLELASFASLGARAGTSTVREPSHATGDPSVAHALARASSLDLVPVGRIVGAAALTLLGTRANETRVELDGIPLAGGAAGASALAARDGLGIAAIELARGPVPASATPRGAIGGIVNYRTIAPGSDDGASVGAGYSSYFGYFQQYRLARRHERLALAFDVTTGDARAHAQTIKLEYALSNATSLGVASYGLQANEALARGGYRVSAPIVAADLRTTIGHATLRVRTYSSSSSASAYGAGDARAAAQIAASPLLANERLEGTLADLALPFGDDVAATTLDRRNERTELASGATVRRSFTTQTFRAELRLSNAARLALADALSSGSSLALRGDPQISLSVRASDAVTMRASAGSSYAVAPAQTLAAQAPAGRERPETAFGYRVDLEQQLSAQTRVYGDAYSLRTRDRYAPLSDGRTSGVELGYDTTPTTGRVVFAGYVDLARSIAFGTPQAPARFAGLATAPGEGIAFAQQPGDPSAKARVEATYRALSGAELRVGNTFYGANNAFSTSGVSLADANLFVPLDPFELRLGVANAFGVAVAPAGLAPYFAPHEFTFSLGHVFGAAP